MGSQHIRSFRIDPRLDTSTRLDTSRCQYKNIEPITQFNHTIERESVRQITKSYNDLCTKGV